MLEMRFIIMLSIFAITCYTIALLLGKVNTVGFFTALVFTLVFTTLPDIIIILALLEK